MMKLLLVCFGAMLIQGTLAAPTNCADELQAILDAVNAVWPQVKEATQDRIDMTNLIRKARAEWPAIIKQIKAGTADPATLKSLSAELNTLADSVAKTEALETKLIKSTGVVVIPQLKNLATELQQ